jgi:hypothetical protein
MTKYRLVHKNQTIIYDNEDLDMSLIKILEMSDIPIETEIVLYLTLGFGYPWIRAGKILFGTKELKKMEGRSDIPDHLICPINMSLIYYAIKLNGRFYDLDSLSPYLMGEINKWVDSFNRAILYDTGYPENVLCPFRIPVPMELVMNILKYSTRDDGTFNQIYENTVSNCFIYDIFVHKTNHDQVEYDKLLKEYYETINGS